MTLVLSVLRLLPRQRLAECHSVVVQQRAFKGNYTGSVGNKQPRLVGTAIDYTIPKHYGDGWINIDGTPRVQIRMHYKADGGWDFYPNRFRGGSLFGFAQGAESTVVLNEAGGLFGLKSEATFKAVRSEVGVSEEDILVQGGAFYQVIFNQVDRVFSFNNEEINRRAFAYNLSSVVNVESIDYGYITDTITVAEDYGNVTDTDLLSLAEGRLRYSCSYQQQDFPSDLEESSVLLRLQGLEPSLVIKNTVTSEFLALVRYTFCLSSPLRVTLLNSEATQPSAEQEIGLVLATCLPYLEPADAVAFVPAKDDKSTLQV